MTKPEKIELVWHVYDFVITRRGTLEITGGSARIIARSLDRAVREVERLLLSDDENPEDYSFFVNEQSWCVALLALLSWTTMTRRIHGPTWVVKVNGKWKWQES